MVEQAVSTVAGRGSVFLGRLGLDSTQFHDVVAASAAGDRQATDRLFGWLRPEIVRYCRLRIVDRGVHYSVPDVVQEICLAALRALPGFRHDAGSFLPYVYGIAAHKVADRHRIAGADQTRATADLPDRVDHRPTPEEVAIVRSDVRRLMTTLSPAQRQILILRVVHGLTADQTARITGTTAETVRVTQHRALRKLRTQLMTCP